MANPVAVDIPCKKLASDRNSEAPPVLDLVHLSRQTFGDHALEVELLTLFERQAAHLAARLADARRPGDSAARMELAHMMKGSARAVGAFAVAASAEAYETALRGGEAAEAGLCDALVAEIGTARAAIVALL
jgi:HPt (histidine-containing phosphotransfer) domain-containing protein